MTKLFDRYKETASLPLDEACSLPFAVYKDSQVAELEAESIFHQQWVFVCATGMLAEVGSYFAFTLAGESVAVVHGKDGHIRAMSNNCSHRGTPLLSTGFGHIEKNIVCPYHAWTYADNGELKGVPFDAAKCVDKQRHELPKYALQEWMGLLFINLSDNPSDLLSSLNKINPYLQHYKMECFTQVYGGASEHWNSNWKLAVENGIESYHLFMVHRETLEVNTPSKKAYYIAGDANWSLTGGEIVEQRSVLSRFFSGDTPEPLNHYVLIYLPPGFIGILTYESFDWIAVTPDGPEHCFVHGGGMAEYAPDKSDKASSEFAAAFLQEDKDICELVQSGMGSRHHKGGTLLEVERIVVDFHQYLAKHLFGAQVSPFHESDAAGMFK